MCEHGLCAAYIAMPNEPPRLFLSYGVHDASELAERLCRDLAARGYQVWQDVNRIRAGRPWDEEVQNGLRNSQVLLALLSPQSVRRARDPGNPTATDSVCLNEIEYAQRARKIPIVPVRVVSCEAPFAIYRLHQIDFRCWRESEATYQGGLIQICAGIEAALRGETLERHWSPSFEPWDFAPFLLEKRNHFTGRQWLFRDLDEWRRKEAPPALLITGEPGIGKSAIVAALVDENQEGQVLAYHCCRADTPATLEPGRFVRSLAGMLAARLEGYAGLLEDQGVRDALERADTDPASAFEAVILSLHSASPSAGDRRYLLIDALDEALAHPKQPTIVELVAARLNRLPPWLSIVATTRSEPGVLSRLRGLSAKTLKADDPKNQDDVLTFLRRRLSEPGLRNKVETSRKTLEDVATGVLRSSAGNFLFVTTAMDAIEAGQLRLDDIESQPPGRLSSLYEVFFNRLFRDAGMDFQPAGQVLEVVAAAREPLSREQIAAVTGLDDKKELPSLLGRLAAFVPVREGRYSLFHHSMFDWLTGWDTQQDQPFAGPYHVSLQAGHKGLADWGWAECRHGIQNVSTYGFRHLLAHFHEAGRGDQARAVLLDFDWLQAKLEATDTNALIADYDYPADWEDLRAIQSAIRLSAHVLARDARQLAGQLVGRLLGDKTPSIQVFLKQASMRKSWSWLRPLRRTLVSPGSFLTRTLEGHTRSVRAVAIAPDGRRAVSASDDRTLRLWDLESGRTIRVLEGHTDSVLAVAVTSDGRRAITGSGDRTLRLWDLESGQTLRTLTGHTSMILAVAVTSDGRYAVSASLGEGLRLWDLKGGQIIRQVKKQYTAVAITANGSRVVSVPEFSWLVDVWDPENGQLVRKLEGHTHYVIAISITPDGHRVVSASADRTLRVWNLANGQSVYTLQGHTSAVSAVSVTPDGCRAISGSFDGTLRVWDLKSGHAVCVLEDNTGRIQNVAITPDGLRAVSVGFSSNVLRVWELPIAEVERPKMTPLSGRIRRLTSAIYKVVSLRPIIGCRSPRRVISSAFNWAKVMAITPDGRLAISGFSDGILQVLEVNSGQTLHTFRGHKSEVLAVAVTAGTHWAVSTSNDRTISVWDLESGRTVDVLGKRTNLVNALAIARKGRRVIFGEGDRICVWDLKLGETKRVKNMQGGHDGIVLALAITSDGLRAVSGSFDKMLRIWDLQSGQALRTLKGHTNVITAVAMTPDGRGAVSASNDQTLRIWDLTRGQLVRTLERGTGVVGAMVITPDGYLVSVHRDNTVQLWDLKNGKELASFTGESPMLACACARDHRTIAAGDESGRVHLLRFVEQTKQSPQSAMHRSSPEPSSHL
jgi:WD40 repeat protein